MRRTSKLASILMASAFAATAASSPASASAPAKTLVLAPVPRVVAASVTLGGNTLWPFWAIGAGDNIKGGGGWYTLAMQTDGNLALYEGVGGATWNSHTNGGGGGGRVTMQGDGNLVVTAANGVPTWSSRTWGHPGARMVMQDDGNMVVYAGNTALWSAWSDDGSFDYINSVAQIALRRGWMSIFDRGIMRRKPDIAHATVISGDQRWATATTAVAPAASVASAAAAATTATSVTVVAAPPTSGIAPRVAITRAQAVAAGVKPAVTNGTGQFWCSWYTSTLAGYDVLGFGPVYFMDHHLKWCYESGGNIYDVPERFADIRLAPQNFSVNQGIVPGSDISYGLNTPQFVSHFQLTVDTCVLRYGCLWTAQPESWVTVDSQGQWYARQ